MERVIITGANGFIGQALIKRLLIFGCDVTPIPHAQLSDEKKLQGIVTQVMPGYIFHLAAYGNMHGQNDSEEIYQANVVNLLNLLGATKGISYKAFINIGSSSEYGNKSKPMSEEDSCDPTTLYAVTKLVGTHIASAFAKAFEKPIITVRPFSVYGPGEANFRFIPTVVRSCQNGEEMTLAPDANHDWIYIDDLISGMLLVAEKAGDLMGGIVNIGTGSQSSNKKVVEIIENLMSKKANITGYKSLRVFDNNYWVADNSKLVGLGWKPKHSLRGGLNNIVNNEKP